MHKIYHFKLSEISKNDHRTVKLGNLIGALSVIVSSLYSMFYYFVLNSTKAALFNEFFAFCYLSYFYLLSRGKFLPATLSIPLVYMCHIFFIVVFFASSHSGIHYYFLVMGPTLYFFFNNDQKFFLIGFSVTAFILFISCEILGTTFSELVLSDVQSRFLYISSISMVFFLNIIIIYIFRKEIDANERKLDEAATILATVNNELKNENEVRKKIEGILVLEKTKLQDALQEVKQLSGLLPICASCKKIRDDKGYWNQIESYIHKHSEAKFSHSICPDCSDELYGHEDWNIEMKKKKK